MPRRERPPIYAPLPPAPAPAAAEAALHPALCAGQCARWHVGEQYLRRGRGEEAQREKA